MWELRLAPLRALQITVLGIALLFAGTGFANTETKQDKIERNFKRYSPGTCFVEARWGLQQVMPDGTVKYLKKPEMRATPIPGEFSPPGGFGSPGGAGGSFRTPGAPPAMPLGDADDPNLIAFDITGSCFLLTKTGVIGTVKHVTIPWMRNDIAAAFTRLGFVPAMIKMQVTFPGNDTPFEIDTAEIFNSEKYDAAVAKLKDPDTSKLPRPMKLADGWPRMGDPVMLVGFPTGIAALRTLASKPVQLLINNEKKPTMNTVMDILRENGEVIPLQSTGELTQIRHGVLVHDAGTAQGVSGGPLLNLNTGELIGAAYAYMNKADFICLASPLEEFKVLLKKAGVDWKRLRSAEGC
jgi:hypothetical protein